MDSAVTPLAKEKMGALRRHVLRTVHPLEF